MPEPVPPPRRVSELKSLETVNGLRLFSDNIKDGVDKLSTFGVVPFSPVVARSRLTKDIIVRPEDLSIGTISDAVHGARFEVHKNSPWHILATRCLIEVDIDALQLQVRVSIVSAGGVDAMLIGDDLPELGPDLVAALAGLEMYNLPHVASFSYFSELGGFPLSSCTTRCGSQ